MDLSAKLKLATSSALVRTTNTDCSGPLAFAAVTVSSMLSLFSSVDSEILNW